MSENFSIQDLSERKYFSMIPYLIHEIGLDVYEIAVYCAIKRSAGENGDCTKSKNSLAKQSGNISTRKLVKVIHSLCMMNEFLKKPLITCQKRDHEYGDPDTNLIKIVDIWIDNANLFQKNRGGARYAPPHAQCALPDALYAPGVVHAMQGGGECGAPKEEPIKKNPCKKTTTTVVDVVVDKNKILQEQEENKAARSLKDFLDKQAYATRKKKGGDTSPWGDDWIIPIQTFEKLINRHGIVYFREQLEYIIQQQKDADRGKNDPIKKPERSLKLACEKNYADSQGNKESVK